MKYVVDRFEGNIAVCNNMIEGEFIDIKKNSLPKEVKEGDVLVKQEMGFIVDKELTEKRRSSIEKRMSKLLRK